MATVNTEAAEGTVAVLLEALRPIVVSADCEGVLRVSHRAGGSLLNRFHAGTGAGLSAGGGSSSSKAAAGATAAGGSQQQQQQPVAVRALYEASGPVREMACW